MTARELNRDIKRLHYNIVKLRSECMSSQVISEEDYYKSIENLRPEFLRLYHADDQFNYMNLNSIKIMLRINNLYRYIPLHNFGNRINLENL